MTHRRKFDNGERLWVLILGILVAIIGMNLQRQSQIWELTSYESNQSTTQTGIKETSVESFQMAVDSLSTTIEIKMKNQ